MTMCFTQFSHYAYISKKIHYKSPSCNAVNLCCFFFNVTMDNGSWPDNHNSWKCKDVAVSKTSLRRFILSSGTRFSSFALMVFKWHEGKVGQFNTIQIGQALSYHTDDIILIPWQKNYKGFLFEDTISD